MPVDFELGGFADRPDAKAKDFAAKRPQRPARIAAALDQLPAQTDDWRRRPANDAERRGRIVATQLAADDLS